MDVVVFQKKRKTLGRTITGAVLAFMLCAELLMESLPALSVHAAEKTNETVSDVHGDLDVILNISQENMSPYVEAFEKKYPNVTVKLEYYSDYENDIRKRIETGEYGDVLFVPAYMSQGQYSAYFKKLGAYQDLSQKYDFLSQSKIDGDNIYGLPSSAYINGIAYNKKVFAEAGISDLPKTEDEFLEDLRLIRQRTDAIPFYTNYSDAWPLQYWMAFPFIEMTGDASYKFDTFPYDKDPFNEGKPCYTVFSLLYNIVKEGLAGDLPMQTNWNDCKGMINDGEIGCMAIGSWAVYQFEQAGGNDEDISFMPFPSSVDGQQYATLSTDYSYGISKNSENVDAANAFISFMIDESSYALDHDGISILKTDQYPDTYANFMDVKIFAQAQGTTKECEDYNTLQTNLNLNDTAFFQSLIEEACKKDGMSFDDMMNLWNQKWESSRTADMEKAASQEDTDQIWQEDTFDENHNYNVSLSDSEKKYCESAVVKVAYADNMAPYSYIEDGKLNGISFDLLEIIEKATGISFVYREYDSPEEARNAVAAGEEDLLLCSMVSEDDLAYSKSYLTSSLTLIYNDNFDKANIASNVEARVKGNDFEFLAQTHSYLAASNAEEAIHAVYEKSADYTVMDFNSASFYLPFLNQSKLSTRPLTTESEAAFAYREDVDTRLISITNKYLYRIPAADMQQLLLDNMDTSSRKISFAQYIESNPEAGFLMIIAISVCIILFILSICILYLSRVKKKSKILEEENMQDALTGIYNRSGFEKMYRKIHTSSKSGVEMFAMLDIDDFKSVNDTLGHEGGDMALQYAARLLNKLENDNLICARYGGDEFVIYAANVNKEAMQYVIDALLRDFRMNVSFGGKEKELSMSIGLFFSEERPSLGDGLAMADKALYEKKHKGKNGVEIIGS